MLIVILNDDDNEGERDGAGEMNHLANMYACILFLCVYVIVNMETHRRGLGFIKAYTNVPVTGQNSCNFQ